MTQFTYKTDDGLYDVEKLNDAAKVAFNYLAEVQSEVLSKKIDVLNAAAKTYNGMLQENLDPEALIAEEDQAES
jgi:hypothetical protein